MSVISGYLNPVHELIFTDTSGSTFGPVSGDSAIKLNEKKLFFNNKLFLFSGDTVNNIILSNPSDGAYGTSGNTISGIVSGDTVENAFDKVENILLKLAPAKPKLLCESGLTVNSLYTAFSAGTTTLFNNVTNNSTPTISVFNRFNGASGIVTASINGANVGTSANLNTNPTVPALYGNLTILNIYDPYNGEFGKQGFWESFDASVTPTTPLTRGIPSQFIINHSETCSNSTTVVYDQLNTISASVSLSGNTPGTRISGVPAYRANDLLQVSYSSVGLISNFYNSNRLVSIENIVGNSLLSGLTYNVPLINNPVSGQTIFGTVSLPVTSNIFRNGNFGTLSAATLVRFYTSNNSISTPLTASSGNIRVDSVSILNERVESKIGQFPASPFLVYNESTLLTSNEELLQENGQYRYPSPVDYTNNIPSGPNYTTIAGGSYIGFRWVTFDMGIVNNISTVTLTFPTAPATNTFSNTNFRMYVMVSGFSWVNAELPYDGVSTPSDDGDGTQALIVGSSSSTVKSVNVTRNGPLPVSGRVYVRIGLSAGATTNRIVKPVMTTS